jgi:RNA recognition motif-containing protein
MNEEGKVYLGNLSYGLTEEELEGAFTAKGFQVKAVRIVKDKMTGRSKGFGFAELVNDSDVETAIEALNGTDLSGRQLRVSRAQKKEGR